MTNFYPAAVKTVRELRPASASDFDDLVQEAVIAAWLATESRELANPQVYGNVVAARRAKSMVTGRYGQFGSTCSGTKTYDPMRHSSRLAPEEWRPEVALLDPAHAQVDEFDGIAAAVRDLPNEDDRMLVYLMFWLDQDRATIAEELGTTAIAVRNRWERRIRPALRESLA